MNGVVLDVPLTMQHTKKSPPAGRTPLFEEGMFAVEDSGDSDSDSESEDAIDSISKLVASFMWK